MVDYSPPVAQVLPFENLPSEDTPLTAEWLNHVNALLADLATAITGRIPVLEAVASTEAIRDTIGTTLVAGTGMTVTVDDAANTVTLANTGTAYTDEQARDAVGTALVAGSGMTVTVNDGSDTITLAATSTGNFAPVDHGYSAWTLDTAQAGSSTILATAGVLYGVQLKLPAAATVTSIACRVTTAGNTLTNTYLALYDSTGTRVGVTADQSAVFNSSGYYAVNLATPYVAAAGTYYVAVVVGTAVTLPTFARGVNSNILNDGMTAAGGFRAWSSGTGQIAAPASVTLSGTAAINQNFWFALKP